jgi:hypothetical protein
MLRACGFGHGDTPKKTAKQAITYTPRKKKSHPKVALLGIFMHFWAFSGLN